METKESKAERKDYVSIRDNQMRYCISFEKGDKIFFLWFNKSGIIRLQAKTSIRQIVKEELLS